MVAKGCQMLAVLEVREHERDGGDKQDYDQRVHHGPLALGLVAPGGPLPLHPRSPHATISAAVVRWQLAVGHERRLVAFCPREGHRLVDVIV